jgi:hypothetical protein
MGNHLKHMHSHMTSEFGYPMSQSLKQYRINHSPGAFALKTSVEGYFFYLENFERYAKNFSPSI